VAIPTLLGAALGIWIDEHYPGSHSWTLALLAIGLGLGCYYYIIIWNQSV
jgi:ATP synthase protein I